MDNSVVVSDMPPLVDNVDFAVGLASLRLVAEPRYGSGANLFMFPATGGGLLRRFRHCE